MKNLLMSLKKKTCHDMSVSVLVLLNFKMPRHTTFPTKVTYVNKYKLVDQPVLLKSLMNQIWHWHSDELGTPEGGLNLTTLTKVKFVATAHFLNAYSSKWLKTCGSTSLIKNSNISNLTLGTVMNWEHLRAFLILPHRQRSNLMV